MQTSLDWKPLCAGRCVGLAGEGEEPMVASVRFAPLWSVRWPSPGTPWWHSSIPVCAAEPRALSLQAISLGWQKGTLHSGQAQPQRGWLWSAELAAKHQLRPALPWRGRGLCLAVGSRDWARHGSCSTIPTKGTATSDS